MSGSEGHGQRENKHDSFRMRFSPDTYLIGTSVENMTGNDDENVSTSEDIQGKVSTEVGDYSTVRN